MARRIDWRNEKRLNGRGRIASYTSYANVLGSSVGSGDGETVAEAQSAALERLITMRDFCDNVSGSDAPRIATWRGETRVVWCDLDSVYVGIPMPDGSLRIAMTCEGTVREEARKTRMHLAQVGWASGEIADSAAGFLDNEQLIDFKRWIDFQQDYRDRTAAEMLPETPSRRLQRL
jgi:hypothetical protein